MNENTLKKLHATEVEILVEIDRVCYEHGWRYYLVGGTLLGAVRHKGFIPWDDDLDIAMPRADFEKFIQEKTLQSGKYFVQSYLTDEKYTRIFAKVRKKGTIFLEKNDALADRNHGIFVDIFPLDYRSENESKLFVLKRRIALRLDGYANERIIGEEIKGHLKYLGFFLKCFSENSICQYRDKILSCVDNSDLYVNYGSQYGMDKQTMPVSVYEPSVKLEFEGKMFNAPGQYEILLERLYGPNYMQLPPKEKQITHNPLRISFDTDGPDAVLED